MITRKRKIKKPSKTDFSSALFAVIMIVFLSLLVFSNFKINQERSSLISEIQKLEEEISKLEQEKSHLEAGISEADTEAYWEEKAREQGFVKEGENPVVVLPPGESLEEESKQKNKGFFEQIMETIKSFLRE